MRLMLTIALFLSAIGCGLIAGFFFAFSVCVMRSLAKLPPAQGVAAMQSINVAVINPWFLTPFLGLAVVNALLIVVSAFHWNEPNAIYVIAGGLLYVLGTFLVTMLFNVPLNNGLANSGDAAALWDDYLVVWTRWNHVRTTASLAAAASFTMALML
jgi:uncharacterized membrane protein